MNCRMRHGCVNYNLVPYPYRQAACVALTRRIRWWQVVEKFVKQRLTNTNAKNAREKTGIRINKSRAAYYVCGAAFMRRCAGTLCLS